MEEETVCLGGATVSQNETYRGGEDIMGTAANQKALTYFAVRELERVFVFA